MAGERYHGSTLRSAAYRLLRPGVLGARALRKLLRRREVPAQIWKLLSTVQSSAEAKDWDNARRVASEAADIAEADGGVRAKRVIGGELVLLGDCGRGLRLLAEPLPRCAAQEWRGEGLAGKRLFIRQLHTSNMGAPVRMARFLPHVLDKAAHAVIIVAPRLVPIFARTFPKAEVRALAGKEIRDADAGDFVTSFEGVAGACVSDWGSIAAFPFTPLRADPGVAAELRRKYSGDGATPVVGISWGSKNGNKDTPDLAACAGLIASFPAIFVSLQYGPIADALKKLQAGGGGVVINDPTVDQLVDMDRFAAQVAAMDAIVIIDNTAAHLAGGIGKPMVLLRDDRFRGVFPVTGSESYWFPHTVMVRREQRAWPAVMEEAATRLREVLALRTTLGR